MIVDLSLRRNFSSSDGVNDRIDIVDNAVKVYTDSQNERFRFGSVNRSFNNLVVGPISNNSKAYIRANNGYSTATTPFTLGGIMTNVVFIIQLETL